MDTACSNNTYTTSEIEEQTVMLYDTVSILISTSQNSL
jgi:hypothetical protein